MVEKYSGEMPMIKSVKIKNFKSIDCLNISFKKFNLLCGENSSGKTSVIHSILALVQNLKSHKSLDGDVLKIGGRDEIQNKVTGGEISITIKTKNKNKNLTLKRNPDPSQDNKDIVLIKPEEDAFDVSFERQLFYLSSNRLGVVDIYPKGNKLFGENGESVVNFFSDNRDSFMPESYMELFRKLYPESSILNNKRFEEHVRFWIERLTNEKVSITSIPYTNQFVLTFGSEHKARPINTGSGYSFIVPIVIVCLGGVITSNDATIIIENPEIYLHPKAQIETTKFLLFISKLSQMIIETHSEHILKVVMDERKKSNQVLVFNKENGKTNMTKLDFSSFKLTPISYAEVMYKAYNMLSIELHIQLFAALHERHCMGKSILDFDSWLYNNDNTIPQKSRQYRRSVYKTLPVYIRNCIDHPEQTKPNSTKKYNYTAKELKKSIEYMLSKL